MTMMTIVMRKVFSILFVWCSVVCTYIHMYRQTYSLDMLYLSNSKSYVIHNSNKTLTIHDYEYYHDNYIVQYFSSKRKRNT